MCVCVYLCVCVYARKRKRNKFIVWFINQLEQFTRSFEMSPYKMKYVYFSSCLLGEQEFGNQ